MELFIPEHYDPRLDIRETQDAIKYIRDTFQKELGKEMIQSYCEIRPLIKEERENLAVRFAYPEKFWKLANYYYTHNKVWIPKKNLEKLRKLISQYEKWLEFVESINTLEK